MRVRLTFVGHIKTLAGEESTLVELPERDPSLGAVLRAAEESHPRMKLFDTGGLKRGILVFRRNRRGGLERIEDLSRAAAHRDGDEEEYVIATGMEGG